MWCHFSRLTLAACFLFCAMPAHALFLDWSTVTWVPGSLSNSYDVDPLHAGNDVTITLSYTTNNNINPFLPDFVDGVQTPAINSNLEGGQGAGTLSLNLAMDLTRQADYITVTVAFSNDYLQGVEGVSFALFDIDRDNGTALYIDRINVISATAADGVTPVAPTISGVGSDVALSGTGLNQVLTGTGPAPDTGIGSDSGNATIGFGSTGITSFTFRWGVPLNNANNPIPMNISFGDINFTPVPEINPAWSALISCLVATGLILHHGTRFRK